MKKVLLSIIFAGTAVLAFAQSSPGIYSNYIYDDFSTVAPYTEAGTTKGLYWGAGEGIGDTLTLTRSGNGELSVVAKASQTYNNSFNLSFGEAAGVPYTLDFSNNADIRLQITNNAASNLDTLRIVIQLTDINGNIGEIIPSTVEAATSDWATSSAPQKMEITINPNDSKIINFDLTTSSANAIGGYHAVSWGCSAPNTCPVTEYILDPSKIKQVLFFVNSGLVPYSGTIAMDYFTMGLDQGTILNTVSVVNTTNVNIYPNPASSSFFVKYNGSNAVVKVSDMAGAVLKTVSGSVSPASVDLSGLKAGIYVVSVEVDGMPVSTKKLVVK